MEYTKQAVAGYTQSVAVPVIAELMRVEYTSLDFHANGKELTVEGVDTRWG